MGKDRTFECCPNCFNSTDGDGIYRCKSCNEIFCDACSDSDECPNCGNESDFVVLYNWYKKLGYISNS